MDTTKLEQKYKKAYRKLRKIITKNDNCRAKKGITSCYSCKKYQECKINGYDEQLAKVKKHGANLRWSTCEKIHQEVKNE